MPYTVNSPDLPSNVAKMPAKKKAQWVAIFNSTLKSCKDGGGSDKTCEGKAFSIANGVVKKQEIDMQRAVKEGQRRKGRPMNWLTTLLSKLTGKGQHRRAMSMDNLMQKVYKAMYEMEEENDTYYSIFRLMIDDAGLWIVLNDHGTLYRANIGLSGDEVTLGELIEVKEEYTPVQNRVFIKRQADGRARFFCIAATSILNRVNEIDSSKLFDNMVQHAVDADYYPAIDIHHLGPLNSDIFDIGYADYLARVGVTYIASGILDETKVLGRKMVEALEGPDAAKWGCSIEYWPIDGETIELNLGDNGTIPIDVYTDGVNTRISFLPEQRAANWFTQVALKERSMSGITKDAMLTLRKLFEDDEDFSEFVEQLGGINEEVEQRGLVHREAGEEGQTEQSDADATEEDDVQEEEVEREVVLDDSVLQMIVDQVVERLESGRQEDAKQRSQSDAKIDQVLQSVGKLTKLVEGQDKRLKELEKGSEELVNEAILDLPPRMRERVVVTHRPSQAAGQEGQLKTAHELANGTLSNLPMPELA